MDALIYNPLWFYLIAVNLYLFCLMGYDRLGSKTRLAVSRSKSPFYGGDWRRIRRFDAQRVFRHKTRKKKFYFFFAFGTVFAILLMVFFA